MILCVKWQNKAKPYAPLCKSKHNFALGFDTEAALVVLRLQEVHPQVKLILVLPYPAQSEKWTAEQRTVCENIKSRAEKIVYIDENYSRGCFHIRNRMLVDEAAVCVDYHTKQEGGTAYTVGYSCFSRKRSCPCGLFAAMLRR
jgi:uncharacterized phage-like protein YoqJ